MKLIQVKNYEEICNSRFILYDVLEKLNMGDDVVVCLDGQTYDAEVEGVFPEYNKVMVYLF